MQFESGALLLYLADKFSSISGVTTPQQRAVAAQWVLFANSTLANSVFVEQFRCERIPRPHQLPLRNLAFDRALTAQLLLVDCAANAR